MMQNERTAAGRFAEGNRIGCGPNPRKGNRRSSRMWTQAIRDACSPDVWQKIIDRAIAEASGEVEGVETKSARDWLSKYVIPRGAQDQGPDLLS